MATLDALCEAETHPEASGVTGLSLLAVDRAGNKLVEKHFGRSSSIGDAPINKDSVFWIYSITKTIVAIAVLKCVELGQIALDDGVYAHLPELKELDIINFDGRGELTFAPNPTEMTVRHLISHTSGIGMDVFDPRLQAWRLSRGEHTQAFSGDSKRAYTLPLVFEPGTGWAYGGGIEWAGILVERLNGCKLGDFLHKHVFQVLGMTSTTFHPDQHPDIKARLVEVSIRISDGTLVPMEGPFPAVTKDDGGAMGLVSSVPDMARLTQDLLDEEPSILSAASVAELFTPQFAPDSAPAKLLSHGAAMYGRLIGENFDPEKIGQVPGAYLVRKDTAIIPGGTLVMTGIPNLVWFVNRDKGIGGLYASAIMPPDDAKSTEVIQAFLKEVFSS